MDGPLSRSPLACVEPRERRDRGDGIFSGFGFALWITFSRPFFSYSPNWGDDGSASDAGARSPADGEALSRRPPPLEEGVDEDLVERAAEVAAARRLDGPPLRRRRLEAVAPQQVSYLGKQCRA